MANPAGVLLDLDGVLYIDNRLIPGAVETVRWLQKQKIPFRYITNTSTRTGAQIQRKLEALGLPVDDKMVFSAVDATEQWLKAQNISRITTLLAEPVETHFAGLFQIDREAPQAVVIGDIGERWDYALLNQVFHWLMEGARLVTIHRNRYWQTGNGLQLDIGAFVAGLEYAADVTAVVVGKPSPLFFETACQSMQRKPDTVTTVGDDIEADVGGAQAAGCRGVLVETGKYRAENVARSSIRPDRQIASIADLPALLS